MFLEESVPKEVQKGLILRCVSRRGVVIRSSVKEVPECSLRELPKMASVEASNAVLAKKKF